MVFKSMQDQQIRVCMTNDQKKRIFLDYCRVKSINSEELIQQSKEEIGCFLINFYAEIRKKDGNCIVAHP